MQKIKSDIQVFFQNLLQSQKLNDIIINREYRRSSVCISNARTSLGKGGITVNYSIIKEIEKEQLKENITPFRVGDTIRVYAKIVEGTRERIQMFEGTVIKRQNGSSRETFTVRRFSYGVGVEKTWPLHSPRIDHIEVVRSGKVRRAKLFYLRKRVGKAAKVKEIIK